MVGFSTSFMESPLLNVHELSYTIGYVCLEIVNLPSAGPESIIVSTPKISTDRHNVDCPENCLASLSPRSERQSR